MSVINGVCEFCNQAVIEGAECTCYEAKREKKSKKRFLLRMRMLTSFLILMKITVHTILTSD